MDPPIRLIAMNKKEMSAVNYVSVAATVCSISVACSAVLFIRLGLLNAATLSSGKGISSSSASVLRIEAVAGALVFTFSSFVLLSEFGNDKPSFLSDFETLKRISAMPLAALVAVSFPFRPLAELLGVSGIPNRTLTICADCGDAVGMTMLLTYLWLYPSVSASAAFGEENAERNAVRFRRLLCFAICGVLRLFNTLLFRVHPNPLPLQSAFSWSGWAAQGGWQEATTLQTSAVILVCMLDIALLSVIALEYKKHSKLIVSAIDNSDPQLVIAMRHLSQNGKLLVINCFVLCVLEAFWPPERVLFLFKHTGDLLLSHQVGHSAVTIAVMSFAAREYFVHHSWNKSTKFAAVLRLLSKSFGLSRSKESSRLVYCVSDERDPLTEHPVPQKDTFSLETATLLFNLSWLATVAPRSEESRKSPADYGHPTLSICACWDSEASRGRILLLHSSDRIILAFSPLMYAAARNRHLRLFTKSTFGKRLLSGIRQSEASSPTAKKLVLENQRLLRRGRLHAGYENAYCSVRESVLDEVHMLLEQKKRPLYVTGFATGGAMATLCAFDLSMRYVESREQTISIYTYGCVKLMNSAMSRLFEKLVPFRWRCLVSGDSVSLRPRSTNFTHPSKVATFTRSGHLAIEWQRTYKWWQSPVSVHPMHTPSAYFCAIRNWHYAFNKRRVSDLWGWPVEKSITALFQQQSLVRDIAWPTDPEVDSSTLDIESKRIGKADLRSCSFGCEEGDDVIAFKR